MAFLPDAARSQGTFAPSSATMMGVKTLGPVQLAQVKAPNDRDEPAAGYADPRDAFVWAFVTAGSIVSTRGRLEIPCDAGHLAVSHMPQVTGFRMTPDFRALSIRIDRDALPMTSAEVNAVSRSTYILQEGTPRLLGSMAAYVMSMHHPLGSASEAAFAQSIIDLTRAFVDDVLGMPSAPELEQRMLVGRARDYIDAHAGSASLTPTSVAEALGVSVRWVQKAFERHGATIADTILAARLSKARALLERETGHPHGIGVIAERSGFRSSSSFSRIFSREFGVAPSAWRNGERGESSNS